MIAKQKSSPFIDQELKLAACGDWCLGGRVEGAFTSAYKLTKHIKEVFMSFNPANISILGSSGAIGTAFTHLLSEKYSKASIFAFSRNSNNSIDYTREDSIAEAAALATSEKPLDLVIVANGILHDKRLMPEISLRDLSAQKFHRIFAVYTITPTLIAKHFYQSLIKNARQFLQLYRLEWEVYQIIILVVGMYRASKAALNMIIKNAAIEVRRSNKQAIIVRLHPGTVDRFVKTIPKQCRQRKAFYALLFCWLLEVLENLSPSQMENVLHGMETVRP